MKEQGQSANVGVFHQRCLAECFADIPRKIAFLLVNFCHKRFGYHKMRTKMEQPSITFIGALEDVGGKHQHRRPAWKIVTENTKFGILTKFSK